MTEQQKRILIAEDDSAIAAMLARVLGETYDVVVAEDGPRAVALAAKQPKPDLLLLDIMMSGIDGLSAAQQIRALPGLRAVPIIFLTARGDPKDVIKGIQAGARHYITKPFKLNEVTAKVKKALGT